MMNITKQQYTIVEQAAKKAGAILSFEEKKSTKSIDVFFARAADRPTARKHVGNHFTSKKLPVKVKKTSLSSEDITETEIGGNTIRIVYKPMSGGMTETTLNSTITELVPCICFMNKITETKIDKLYKEIVKLPSSKHGCYVSPSDIKSGVDFIEQMPESSLYSAKMSNAIAIRKFLFDTDRKKKINKVSWTYRAKPEGVPANSPADIVIHYQDGTLLGVSLKAGGASTKEPLLNTYVKPVYEYFDTGNTMSQKLRRKLFDEVYSKVGINSRNYDEPTERQKTLDKLEKIERDNQTTYDKMYDKGLEIIRKDLMKIMTKDYKKFVAYCRKQILKQSDVPTIIIKAVNDTYKEVKDSNRLNVLLTQANKVTAEASRSSKQNFIFCLYRGNTKIGVMNMSVRSNQVGVKHKLGQFYNLAVKYNGLD